MRERFHIPISVVIDCMQSRRFATRPNNACPEVINMAMPESIAQRWNEMTEEEQQQATSFIDFLLMRRKQQKPLKTHFQFDALAGGLEYISENFDDTPEEFKEYM